MPRGVQGDPATSKHEPHGSPGAVFNMLEKEGTGFAFLLHPNRSHWPDQHPALGQVRVVTLNPREMQAGCRQGQGLGHPHRQAAGAHSSEFTASGFFRKLFPGLLLQRRCWSLFLLPVPSFFAQLELNSCTTHPISFPGSTGGGEPPSVFGSGAARQEAAAPGKGRVQGRGCAGLCLDVARAGRQLLWDKSLLGSESLHQDYRNLLTNMAGLVPRSPAVAFSSAVTQAEGMFSLLLPLSLLV